MTCAAGGRAGPSGTLAISSSARRRHGTPGTMRSGSRQGDFSAGACQGLNLGRFNDVGLAVSRPF